MQHSRPETQLLSDPGQGPPAATGVGVDVPAAQVPPEQLPEQHCWLTEQLPEVPIGYAHVPSQHSSPSAHVLADPGQGPPTATGVGVLVPAAHVPLLHTPEQHWSPKLHGPATPMGDAQ